MRYIEIMRFVILGLLLDGRLSLYDVHKRFTGSVSLFYAASFGSIQRALAHAHTAGWVAAEASADSRRRKKLYELTARGRQAWHEWMMAPVTGANAESLMLAKAYFLGELPIPERGECLAVLRASMAEGAGALASLAADLDRVEVAPEAQEAYRYQRATLDYGIRSHAVALTWLDELKQELR